MNNLINKSFNQNEITVINKDSQAWFVASEVANALSYRNANDMTRVLDTDESDTHTVRIRSKNGREQNRKVRIINESGLYHALFKSRKKEAIAFRKWVTKEVLPEIRKNGTYTVPRKSLTPEQQRHVQKMVACKVANDETTSYSRVYSVLKDKFQVGTYKDIHQDDYSAVCAVFNEQPMEGEYIPKKNDMAATLKQEIESEIAKHGDSIDITSACVDNTRVRAILNILDKRGINVDAARKEHCFTREQLYLNKNAVNTMIDQVKSFKRHCSQIITDTKYFEMQFGIFENQTKLAHDYCGRNLIGCGV
jgi:prophage antirepressor-like protein